MLENEGTGICIIFCCFLKMSEICMQEMSEESNLKLSEKTILGCQKEVSLFIVFDKSKL